MVDPVPAVVVVVPRVAEVRVEVHHEVIPRAVEDGHPREVPRVVERPDAAATTIAVVESAEVEMMTVESVAIARSAPTPEQLRRRRVTR